MEEFRPRKFWHSYDHKAQTPLYRVLFVNQDKVFEVYALSYQSVVQFLEIEELVFGERSSVVVTLQRS